MGPTSKMVSGLFFVYPSQSPQSNSRGSKNHFASPASVTSRGRWRCQLHGHCRSRHCCWRSPYLRCQNYFQRRPQLPCLTLPHLCLSWRCHCCRDRRLNCLDWSRFPSSSPPRLHGRSKPYPYWQCFLPNWASKFVPWARCGSLCGNSACSPSEAVIRVAPCLV